MEFRSEIWDEKRVREETPLVQILIKDQLHTAIIRGNFGEGSQKEYAVLETIKGEIYRATWAGIVISLNNNDPLRA